MAYSATRAMKQAPWARPVFGDAPGKVTSHPTRERLIEAALQILEADGSDAVTSDRVLQVSGISKGSLYHHFADFSELLELVLARHFAATVDWSIAGITEVLTEAQSREDFFGRISKLLVETHAPARAVYRLRRAMLAGMTVGNARFQQTLGREQDRLTKAMIGLFQHAQQKGWVTNEVDAHASAVLVQAYTLGLVVDDIAIERMSPIAWNQLIERLVLRVFN